MKKVLVTGATGFIGRHALPQLAAAGYEVHAVTSRAPGGDDSAVAPEGKSAARWHRADLMSREETRRLVADVRPTHLLHLAWYAEPGAYWTSAENFRWVQASLDLFEAFADAGGARVVAAGTCAEYEWGSDEPCAETATPLRPATLYGACKHATHLMLEAFARQRGLSAAWGRVFFLYGPHERPQRLVPAVVRALRAGEPARCTHGEQIRDVLHVADVASAFVALLGSPVTGAVNVASGRAVALKEVIGEIGRALDRESLIRLGALSAPAGEPRVLAAEVGRLRDEVGWSPRFDLRAGLEDTILWWRQRLRGVGVAPASGKSDDE